MFILFSLSSTWKLRLRRFSSISLPFVVEPYLDGCPVKVVQLGKFFNNSVRWILAVFVHGLKVLDSFQFVQKIPVTHHLLKAFFYSMTKFFQKSMATGTGWRCRDTQRKFSENICSEDDLRFRSLRSFSEHLL